MKTGYFVEKETLLEALNQLEKEEKNITSQRVLDIFKEMLAKSKILNIADEEDSNKLLDSLGK